MGRQLHSQDVDVLSAPQRGDEHDVESVAGRYLREGYLALPDIVSAEAVAEARDIALDLIAARAGEAEGNFLDLLGTDAVGAPVTLPQILMPQRYAPALARSPLARAARAIATALLGPEVIAEGQHLICKPGRGGPATPLHQDEAFWSPATAYRSLSIWFPLVDVDVSTGCMQFVPRSHLGGILAHRRLGGDPGNNSVEVVDPERFAPVPVALAAGGATVHHCRTLHGASANHGLHARPAYIFGFGLPARSRSRPLRFPWQEGARSLREERVVAAGGRPTRMRPEIG